MVKIDKVNLKGSRKAGPKRTVIFIISSLFIAGLILFSGLAYIYSITPSGGGNSIIDTIKFIVKPGETAFRGSKTMNILCLGIDYNHDSRGMIYTKGARSDTIFVLSLDAEAKHVNMLSIPRDTWVNIPGYGYEKINSAYSIGYENGGDSGAINLARKTVTNFLGVPIDHHIIIKVKATQELVDTIGGLEIDVPKDMDYDDNWGNLHIHLKKGPQKLNGTQIVGFSRFRHDEESDWGRMKRQQMVINSLIRELKKPENIVRADKLIKVAKENIETDLTIQEITDLARLYKDFDRQNMKTGIVKGDDAVSDSGAAIIIPNDGVKKQLVSKLLLREGEDLGTDLKVSIYNGSRTEGEATELAGYLEDMGYEVVKIADASKYDYENSVITRYILPSDQASPTEQTQNSQTAQQDVHYAPFRNLLGFIDIKTSQETPPNGEDISITIGNKWEDWKKDHPMPVREKTVTPQQASPGVYKSRSGYEAPYTPSANENSSNSSQSAQPSSQELPQPAPETEQTQVPEQEPPADTENDPSSVVTEAPPPEPVPKRSTVPIPHIPSDPEPAPPVDESTEST